MLGNVSRNARTSFRAVGLRVLDLLKRGTGNEGAKPVMRKSFWIALSRCGVHLVPILVFSWLLTVNYKTVYFSPGFSVLDRYDAFYLALFQIAAKCQELFCIASLSTVLLEILRHELLHGGGIPLGLLPSHLWFNQASSLLSPEFLTGIQRCWQDLRHCFRRRSAPKERRVKWSHLWRSFRLVALIFAFVLLAALIGPFTAVLMVPKYQAYPAGGTRYSLEASVEQLWPNIVDASAELEVCSWSNATEYAVCPSGGYSAFSLRRSYKNIYDSHTFRPSTTDDETDGHVLETNFVVMEPRQLLPPVLSTGNFRESFWKGAPTRMAQPNMYTVLRLQMLLRDWRSAADSSASNGGFLFSRRQYVHAASPIVLSKATHPVTHTRCTAVQNLTINASSALFPQMAPRRDIVRTWSLYPHESVPADISSLIRDPSDHVRVQWIQLPARDFGNANVSTGLLLELPWSRTSSSRAAIGCTIQALWVPGVVDRSPAGNWYTSNFYGIGDPPVRADLSPNDPKAADFCRLIDLRPSWLALLTPKVPDPPSTTDSWIPNTLEKIFYDAGFDSFTKRLRTEQQFLFINGTCMFGMLDPSLSDHDLWNVIMCSESGTTKSAFAELVIARLVSDGLSRRYSHIPFSMQPSLQNLQDKGTPHDTDYPARLLEGSRKHNAIVIPDDSTYVIQRADFFVNGYGYMAASWSDKMATAVVGVYLLFSASHVLWTLLVTQVSSSSWDTALELLLLAYNSVPTSTLRGTSAQIGRWNTYRRIVKVRAEEQDDPAVPNRKQLALRLVLDEDCPTQDPFSADANDPAAQTSSSTNSVSNVSAASQHVPSTAASLRKVEVDREYI